VEYRRPKVEDMPRKSLTPLERLTLWQRGWGYAFRPLLLPPRKREPPEASKGFGVFVRPEADHFLVLSAPENTCRFELSTGLPW
jgi:hypothetical protein